MPLAQKPLLGLLGLAIAAYLSACLWLYLYQTRMIFFPLAAIETTPADFGVRFEEVWIPVGSEQLHGWWIPASGPATGTMLYLHGNGANIGSNAEQATRFHQIGLSVLLIDYRGYGQSVGQFPNEQQVYEDAEASWQYLVQNLVQDSAQRPFVYGHSLGGAIAIHLAHQHPDAAGLIVQSSFTSMRQMVDYQMPYSIFPINLLLNQKFDSIAQVPGLKMPVLYIHGLSDTRVPATMSQALYAASPDPKQLYLVPEAGHNNVAQIAGPDYLKQIRAFVQQSLRLEPV